MNIGKEYAANFLENLNITEVNLSSEQIKQHKEQLTSLSDTILKENFGGIIRTFIPGRYFTSLSVTGGECELNCEHCHSNYLTHMIDVATEEKLRAALDDLVQQGAYGCLLSGGCDIEGKVPILQFADVIKEYKKKSNLLFNFHVGLLQEPEIQKLAELNPDFVSFDFTIDENIIKEVYHLEKSVQDYIDTYSNLLKYKIRTVPHICIGLNFGKTHKELQALQMLSKYPTDLIVFLVIIPPQQHPEFQPANISEIEEVFTNARLIFPQTELSLGCMRPRGELRHKIEQLAIQSGFNRFEIPSKRSIKILRENGYLIKTYNLCCAVGNEALEHFST
jgi:uncharacterized radical SAM superfamily protein